MLPEADFLARTVKPDYAGGHLLNLVADVGRHFGLASPHAPLHKPLPLGEASSVVVVVIDGLGEHQLQAYLASGQLPKLARRLPEWRGTLTSTFPSTTMSAMTTLYMAEPPAVTGWLGYSLFDGDDVLDMLFQRRATPQGEVRALNSAELARLRGVDSQAKRLSALGVPCRHIAPATFQNTFLTDWFSEGADFLGYENHADVPALWPAAFQPGYTLAYFPEYDIACHAYGVGSPQAVAELHSLDGLLAALLDSRPRDCAVLLLADHGHINVAALPPSAEYLACLNGLPAGEGRALTARFLPGKAEAARHLLSEVAEVLTADELWAQGWYGGPPQTEADRARVGELTAVPRSHFQFVPPGRPHLRGTHGGWTEAEMRVPVLCWR